MAKYKKRNNNDYQKPSASLGTKVAIWIMAGLMVASAVVTMIVAIMHA